jgi:dTDP-glucose 4,6-dehydratase
MNTYKVPGFIVNCMNIFGERQHPEKYIPICIRKIRDGEKITIHGTKDKSESGSRFYIHARNVAAAVHWLLPRAYDRDKYNIVGEQEISNLELALKIGKIMGKEVDYEIVDFHSSRPGHDLRYGLDGWKLRDMGYEIPVSIDESLKKTVEWTLENSKWLEIGDGCKK